MKITKQTLRELDRKIEKEKNLKRKTFLIATRNVYSRPLGVAAQYRF